MATIELPKEEMIMRADSVLKRQRKWWYARKIAAILLSTIMCILPVSMAFAESAVDGETEAADTTYARYLGGAVDATAIMESKAIQDQVFLTEGADGWDFRTVDFASPKMALLFFPTKKQRAEITIAFNTGGINAVKPMANAVNSQFSEDYAKLAEELYQEGEFDPALEEGSEEIPMAVVLLFYDRHISITIFEDGKYGSEFLMSDQTVLPTVDENYLPQRLSAMGLTGVYDQVMYDESQLDAIFEAAGSRSADPAVQAVVDTEDTFLQMAGEMSTGSAYVYNSSVTSQSIIDSYALDHEEEYADELAKIKAVRTLSEEAFKDVEGWSWNGINASSEPYLGLIPALSGTVYEPDKKIIIVTHEEGDEAAQIDYSLESILPDSNLPDSPVDADQIIFVESSWDFSGVNNGINVYDCKTGIFLYDAQTLQELGMIGTAVNTLSGFVMVSGDSYYPPVPREDVKAEIMDWIGGAQETDETEA